MNPFPSGGIGASLGLLLAYFLPGENTWLRMFALPALFQLFQTCFEQFPSASRILRHFARKPNAIFVDDSSQMFRHIESFVVSKYLDQIRACRLLPRNGEFTYSLANVQFTKPLTAQFRDQEIQLRIVSSSGDYELSGESLQSLFYSLDRVPLGNDGNNRSGLRSRGGEGDGGDDDGAYGNGKMIVLTSWTLSIVELRQYVNELCNFRSSAQITVMYVPEVTGSLGGDGEERHGGRRVRRAGGGQSLSAADAILSWQAIHVKSNCRLSNTVLSRQVERDLLDDVRQFMASEDWYNKKGIPWKRGYVLSGPPGTGKTSTMKAIAAEYNLPVFIIDFGIVRTNLQLQTLMKSINPCINGRPYILALEDCDRSSLFRSDDDDDYRYERDDDSISVGFFLQELDGLVETHGRLLFMTVNNPERLKNINKDALMRPGRIDRQVVIDLCDFEQLQRLIRHFFGEHEMIDALRAEQMKGKHSPAAVINLLQRSARDETPAAVIAQLFRVRKEEKRAKKEKTGEEGEEREAEKQRLHDDPDADVDDKVKARTREEKDEEEEDNQDDSEEDDEDDDEKEEGEDDDNEKDNISSSGIRGWSGNLRRCTALSRSRNYRLKRAKRDVIELQRQVDDRELTWKKMEIDLERKKKRLERLEAIRKRKEDRARLQKEQEDEQKRVASRRAPKTQLLSLPAVAANPLYVRVVRPRGRPKKKGAPSAAVLQVAPLSLSVASARRAEKGSRENDEKEKEKKEEKEKAEEGVRASAPPEFVSLNGILYRPVRGESTSGGDALGVRDCEANETKDAKEAKNVKSSLSPVESTVSVYNLMNRAEIKSEEENENEDMQRLLDEMDNENDAEENICDIENDLDDSEDSGDEENNCFESVCKRKKFESQAFSLDDDDKGDDSENTEENDVLRDSDRLRFVDDDSDNDSAKTDEPMANEIEKTLL